MPRRNASRPQAKPVLLTHECAWPGCPAGIEPGRVVCKSDWLRVPTHLRHAWADAKKSGSAEAVELARSAIAAYARRNQVSEEASTSR
jgi:hypothetical protein